MLQVRRWVSVLLAVLILSGCGMNVAPSSDTGKLSSQTVSLPPQTESETEEKDLSPEQEKLLYKIASLYEVSCIGRTLEKGQALHPADGIAFQFLQTHGLLTPYETDESESWSVPYTVLAEINRLFFVSLEEMDDFDKNAHGNYAGGLYQLPYALKQRELLQEEDGSVLATYDRTKGDAVLTPVSYRFVSHRPEEIPDVLRGLYQPGDTLYKIVSVTQRPDLLQEIQPQTIEIGTAEELLAAAERINEGKYESRFDTYLLTADIDLSGVEWTPIGLNNCVLDTWWDEEVGIDPNNPGFNGTFDGQGHTIRGLTITEEQSRKWVGQPQQNFPERPIDGLGFFYSIGSYGTVKNLALEDCHISLPLTETDFGVSAGLLAAGCSGNVENVSVQGSVQGVTSVGGMFGYLGKVDDNCTARNCSAVVDVKGHYAVGGLVGTLHYGTLEGCTSGGKVTAVAAAGMREGSMPFAIGGIVGHGVQGHATDSHAAVYVLTEVESGCVGGFGGLWEGGSVFSCSIDRQKAGNWEPIDDYHRFEPEIEVK